MARACHTATRLSLSFSLFSFHLTYSHLFIGLLSKDTMSLVYAVIPQWDGIPLPTLIKSANQIVITSHPLTLN